MHCSRFATVWAKRKRSGHCVPEKFNRFLGDQTATVVGVGVVIAAFRSDAIGAITRRAFMLAPLNIFGSFILGFIIGHSPLLLPWPIFIAPSGLGSFGQIIFSSLAT